MLSVKIRPSCEEISFHKVHMMRKQQGKVKRARNTEAYKKLKK
jgi:hypothetical protein